MEPTVTPAARELHVQTVCLLILSSIGVAGALYWLRPVRVPLVLAVFFAGGLTPLIELQVSYLRAPRWLAFSASC